jgi:hypothetical protein
MWIGRRHAAAILAAASAIIACHDGTVGPTSATVRLVNAMPDVTSLSFAANGASLGAPVAFRGYSGCSSVAMGNTTFAYRETGDSTTLVRTDSVTLVSGRKYTLIATGSAAAPSYMTLADTFSSPAVNHSRLRVVNAIVNAGPVDVYVSTIGAPLGTPNQSNVDVNTAHPFLDVPAGGGEQVRLTMAGTATVIATASPLTFGAGQSQTVVFTAPPTGGGTNTFFLVPGCP